MFAIVFSLGSEPFIRLVQGEKQLGSIHGVVVDERGIPINEVNVTVYDSYGKIIDATKTDEEGFFRFALLGGDYKVSLEKKGYIKVEIGIVVPDNAGLYYDPYFDPVDMGVITLKTVIKLQTPVLTRLVSPRSILIFPITLTNLSEKIEDVELSTYDSAGWKTRILDELGEVRRVLLASGSMRLTLEVDVPPNASGINLITVRAQGSIEVALNITLLAQATRRVEISSAFPSASSEIGGEIAYPLLIKNTGDTSETLNLLATIPEGWDVRFISSSKMVVLQVYLQPGESEQLTVVISPPIDVGIGSYNLTIKAVALDGELASSLDLKASIRQPLEKVEVAAVFKEVTVKAGASLRYPITIRNKGEKDSMLLLSIDSIPENWDAIFELEGEKVSVSQVLVTAGGVSNLDLIVTPPSIVNIGNYKVVATIKTMDGTFEKQIDVAANIIGSYSLKASASTLYTSLASGGSASFTVTVTNNGQSPVTTLKLSVDAPSGWESSLTPIQIASVAPKESESFNVLVGVPDSTVAGDYMITVKAESDQVDSSEIQIRVTVSAPTSWGLIGIGVALVAVIGLVIVFRKFSRR